MSKLDGRAENPHTTGWYRGDKAPTESKAEGGADEITGIASHMMGLEPTTADSYGGIPRTAEPPQPSVQPSDVVPSQLKNAILWALGELDDFPERKNGEGAYWWRIELRRRAFGQLTAQEKLTNAMSDLIDEGDAKEEPSVQGEQDERKPLYRHDGICSGDRKNPAGTKGVECCCKMCERCGYIPCECPMLGQDEIEFLNYLQKSRVKSAPSITSERIAEIVTEAELAWYNAPRRSGGLRSFCIESIRKALREAGVRVV